MIAKPSPACAFIGILLPIAGLFVASSAIAQPITPATDGTGTIVTPNGNELTITGGTQAGANLFHSFQQFGLSSNQIATFLATPDLQNILGRVTGGDPSVINGLLQITGGSPNLYLLNPAGIIFGPNASLNVPGSFTATTATGIGFGGCGVSDVGCGAWFNAYGTNNYATLIGNPTSFLFNAAQPGNLINAGHLSVRTGHSLNLIGSTTINTGTLTAPGGSITVIAVPNSSLVRLSQPGSLLSLEIDRSGLCNGCNGLPSDQPSVTSVTPSVASLPELLTGSGFSPQATGLSVDAAGTVRLTATNTVIPQAAGTTIVSGAIDTSVGAGLAINPAATTTGLAQNPPLPTIGGTVQVLGDRVGLLATAINASGIGGGGTVLIGGDFQGKGQVPNAQVTIVDPTTTIAADALYQGDGGKVIAWANDTARFFGSITARGGVTSGNGGFVEVSGKQTLVFHGRVDTSALNGANGTLFLDPNQITIVKGNVGIPTELGNNNPTIWGAGFASGEPLENVSVEPQTIGVNDIYTLLLANDLALEATGNITWSADAILDYNEIGATRTLTLTAGNAISFSGNITDSVAGGESLNLVLNADRDADGLGTITLTNATIVTNGGDIVLGGGANPLTNPAIGTSTSGITLTSTSLDAGGGNISLLGQSTNASGLNITNNSVLRTIGNGTMTLQGNATGSDNFHFGVFLLNNPSGLTTQAGNLRITGSSSATGGNDNVGIQVNNTLIQSTSGSITLVGTSTGSGNAGITNNSVIQSVDGTIALTGNSTAGRGVAIDNASGGTVQTTGNGNITIAGTGTNGDGVQFQSGTSIRTTGSGSISVTGTSGSGGSGVNTTGALVQTTGSGSITLLGTALTSGTGINLGIVSTTTGNISGTGTGRNSWGIVVNGAISATNGTIALTGTNPGSFEGIRVNQPILTTTGGISLSGTSAGSGVWVVDSGQLNSSGGAISVTGNNTSISGRHGVIIDATSGGINSTGGTITLQGTSVPTSTDVTINHTISADNGTITLTGDRLAIGAPVIGTGDLQIQPRTSGLDATIGGNSTFLNAGSLAAIGNNISLITIGGSVPLGTVTLNTNANFSSPVSITNANRLVGADRPTQWTIIATNRGSLSGFPNGLSFSNVGNLTGGNQADVFQFLDRAGVTGTIDGGAGFDSLDYTNYTTPFTVDLALGTATSTSGIINIETFIPQISLPNPPNGDPNPPNGNPNPNPNNPNPPNGDVTNLPDNQRETIREILNNLQGEKLGDTNKPGDVNKPGNADKPGDANDRSGRPRDQRSPDVPITLVINAANVRELPATAVDLAKIDSGFSSDFANYLGVSLDNLAPNVDAISILRRINQQTGINSAFVFINFVPVAGASPSARAKSSRYSQVLPPQPSRSDSDSDELELLVATADGKYVRRRLQGVTRQLVMEAANRLRTEITDPSSDDYLVSAQKLYQWLIAPLETTLQGQKITHLSLLLAPGLRSLPLAVLHDGKQFMIEKYSVGLMPSLAMTDTTYTDLRNDRVLAMGASTFKEQNPLPAVPEELRLIADDLWQGESYLNEAFTLENLKTRHRQGNFQIIHLATHGDFRAGNLGQSYIQFWDTRLRLDQIRGLGLDNPKVDLLVLSACRTALGNDQAELGFAGLAFQAGVKSVLGSLWYVSDEGTLALMNEFYTQLRVSPTKAEALRRAQLALIHGKVMIQDGQVRSGDRTISLPSGTARTDTVNLSHPYYWAAFTMVGSPW